MIVERETADPQHSASITYKIVKYLSYSSSFEGIFGFAVTKNGLFCAGKPVERIRKSERRGVRRPKVFKITEYDASKDPPNGTPT